MLRHWIERVRTALLLLVVSGVVTYVAIGLVIGRQVDDAIEAARSHHDGDAVEVLVATALDPTLELAVRDSAIWALGQLGAPDAVPALQSLETGEACDHAHDVCQRGVRKALHGCRGGFNASAPVWRHGEIAAR